VVVCLAGAFFATARTTRLSRVADIEIIDVRWSENGKRSLRRGNRLRLGNSANVPVHESYLVVGIRSAGIFLERCLEVF
jgi:hypothetical protein